MIHLRKVSVTNWHYIEHKIIDLNESVSFFTGQSGSGKSTLVDAIQLVLLGNTQGERFFNKAAQKESSRTLLEYLRGSQTEQDGKREYLRNDDFSSHVVLEWNDTVKKKGFCTGVLFDVEINSASPISSQFFILNNEIPENKFISAKKPLTISEFKSAFSGGIFPDSSKTYRKELLTKLGHLNDKFFRIFKKSVAFNVDTNLEDFIKNFICKDEILDVEEMQEDIRQLNQFKDEITNLENEINELDKIKDAYNEYASLEKKEKLYGYFNAKSNVELANNNILIHENSLQKIKKIYAESEIKLKVIEDKLVNFQSHRDNILSKISLSKEGNLKDQYENEIRFAEINLNKRNESEKRIKYELEKLENWKFTNDEEFIALLGKVRNNELTNIDFLNLKEKIEEGVSFLEEAQRKYKNKIEELENEKNENQRVIEKLLKGEKDYPRYLIKAKTKLMEELYSFYGKRINVQILSDVAEIKSDTWRSTIEGFLGRKKLSLIVEPNYFEKASEIYRKLDLEEKWKIKIVDTEILMTEKFEVFPNSLIEEIQSQLPYVQKYLQFLLGKVIKCRNISEMRGFKVSVLEDGTFYQGYTIGKVYSDRNIIGDITAQLLKEKHEEKILISNHLATIKKEFIEHPCKFLYILRDTFKFSKNDWFNWIEDVKRIPSLEVEIQNLSEKLDNLDLNEYENLLKDKREIEEKILNTDNETKNLLSTKSKAEEKIENLELILKDFMEQIINKNQELNQSYDSEWITSADADNDFETFLSKHGQVVTEDLINLINQKRTDIQKNKQGLFDSLQELRRRYCQGYEKNFRVVSTNNMEFKYRKEEIEKNVLPTYCKRFEEQQKHAEHRFYSDFIYKIHNEISEAKITINEINKSVRNVKFGKSYYSFSAKSSKNSEIKAYYDMFMDPMLQEPDGLFAMSDEELTGFQRKYVDQLTSLREEILPQSKYANDEEKRKNEAAIRKYADYRTYLSFEMYEQNESGITTELTSMITKNSGGETQNPLYVALLASYISLYRLKDPVERISTLRLIVFDEAFNKMDATKVKMSIELIRKLGLQAIVVAPNDKIPNYLESVNHFYYFTNQGKRKISIASFDKKDFQEKFQV